MTTLQLPSKLQDAKRMKVILEGTTSPRPACSQCRLREIDLPDDQKKMFRCARCKVAFYCSISCQKKAFSFHKLSCKYIAQLRTSVEQGEGSLSIGGRDTQRQYQDWELASILSTLGDEYVKLGYRTTDTIENGSAYYRQALLCCIQILPLGEEAFFHIMNPVEDKILLLLVVLGADQETVKEWMQHSGSPRRVAYEEVPVVEVKGQPPPQELLENQGIRFDVTLQMVAKLMVLMREVAQHRQENPELDHHDHPNKKEIQDLIAGLQSHGKGGYLVHLRDSIPLDPKDAPELFRGGPNSSNNQEVPPTIREFWLLYQDCFFLTPGLNSVLHEFVPEEEDTGFAS